MSITKADIKPSGDIAVNPLIQRVRGDSSASSGSAKEAHDAFRGHETTDRATRAGHIDPSKHAKTFERFGDESFYTPIDSYEGRHRFDPKFEWEPHEERKLVRKVRDHSAPIADRTTQR